MKKIMTSLMFTSTIVFLITWIFAFVIVLSLTGCGNSTGSQPESSQEAQQEDRSSQDVQQEDGDMQSVLNEDSAQETTEDAAEAGTGSEEQSENRGKTLVVYFSVPETDSADNMTDEEDYSTFVRNGEVLGNVQYVAYLIQENTGADIFRIEPVTPYPMNHADLEEVATQEKRDEALPEIASQIEGFDDYDTVFVGYPNWYADMPRIMYSMFEAYDFSGKKIIPFVVSGGSGFSNTISTITELESGAEVETDGYSITRTSMEDAESGVPDWLNRLGY